MPQLFAEPSRRLFLFRIVLPIVGAALTVLAAVALLLVWSGRKADEAAFERQHRLMSLVVSQMLSGIAHDQESATVWDEAVREVARPYPTEWIDGNLGAWMGTYFGHDGAYVLDPRDRPVYAFAGGETREPKAYGEIVTGAAPLVAELRARLRRSDTSGTNDRILSPGAADVTVVKRRPAIVSVKPIVSDSGDIEQTPGDEYLHVAVRFMDGSLLDDLSRDYLFEGLRFSWNADLAPGEASVSLASVSGATVGHFIWRPYRPGSAVFASMAPALAALAALIGVSLTVLIAMLRRRSLHLRSSEAKVRHLALHDALTGLPNRLLFGERLSHALAARGRNGGQLAVLYLDLDRFKQVNDTLGHPSGDELIRQVGKRLQALVRAGDTVARLGGDEFTVILPDVKNPEEVHALCRRIVDAIAEPFSIDGNHVSVGMSIGVALAPEDGAEGTELTRKADIALYHAKSTGRNRFAVFGKDMDALLRDRRAIEQDLRAALLRDDQIDVFFQPLLAAGQRNVTGVEALLRWRHPERGWVPPDIFIPIAEESGLIEKLGERALRKACRVAKSWSFETLAVNVSAVELRNPAYAVRVANLLLAEGMSPHRLELEVTESALASEVETCQANLRALRELGVRFALDDFGTGFSSLNRLQRMDVDRIKIDRSFVRGFGGSGGDEAIVQAIVDLAKATGLKVTAEGVETSAQSDYLTRIGCDELQGFLFSKAVPAAEIDSLIGRKAA